MKGDKKGEKTILINKKAAFNYILEEALECGVALEGTEVKSLREGKASFGSCYVKIENGRLILVGFTIQPYAFGSVFNHKPMRERYLLAHKKEIKRLERKTEEKGYTLIPYRIYFKGNLVKFELYLAKGRDTVGKKQLLKERDIKRDAEREIKSIKRLD